MDPTEYWQKHAQQFAGLYEKPTWFNRTFRRALYLRTEMTVQRIQQTPGATVLDVGCGPGTNSVLFVLKGGASRLVGVDLSQNMIDMARALAEEHGVQDRCEFITGDFMDADVPGGPFDYTTALGVMDYIRDPIPMLARMRQLTTREALATFPGHPPVRMTLRRIRYRLRGSRIFGFSQTKIDRMYRDAGFADCRVERCTGAGYLGIGLVGDGQ